MKLSEDGTVLLNVDNNDIKPDGTYDIPEGITSIGTIAFWGCKNLRSITIPEGVISIKNRAFEGCLNLRSITLPNKGLKYIGNHAFFGCERLQSITLPEDLISIGNGAFIDCKKLRSIIVPEGVTSLEEATFRGCCNLQSVILPNWLIDIGNAVFWGCENLRSIILPNGPNGILTIGYREFEDCKSLQSLIIPDGVILIDELAFDNCENLRSILLPKSVATIRDRAFNRCNSLHSIAIATDDEAEIKRVASLLPIDLQAKVVSLSMYKKIEEPMANELLRVENTAAINPLYDVLNLKSRYTLKARDKRSETAIHYSKLPDEIFPLITGFIKDDNPYYKKAVNLMSQVPLPKNESEVMAYRKNLEDIANAVIEEAKYSRFGFILEQYLHEIARKENLLRQARHSDAADAAKRLIETIRASYYQNLFPMQIERFKRECQQVIDEVRPELEMHRGCKLLLSYLLLVITGVGGLMVMADIGYCHATGKHLSFFQTDTAQKVSALQEKLDEFCDSQFMLSRN